MVDRNDVTRRARVASSGLRARVQILNGPSLFFFFSVRIQAVLFLTPFSLLNNIDFDVIFVHVNVETGTAAEE